MVLISPLEIVYLVEELGLGRDENLILDEGLEGRWVLPYFEGVVVVFELKRGRLM